MLHLLLCLPFLLMDSIAWLWESHFRVTSIKKFCCLVSESVTSGCFPWWCSFILCQSKNFLLSCTALFTESAI